MTGANCNLCDFSHLPLLKSMTVMLESLKNIHGIAVIQHG